MNWESNNPNAERISLQNELEPFHILIADRNCENGTLLAENHNFKPSAA
jgi:hypothetical protein